MKQLKDLYKRVLIDGELVDTRSGETLNMFDARLQFDLNQGFPVVTSKKLPWQAVVGELLWFLSGSTKLSDLKKYTFNDPESDKWTIWTDDFKRWGDGEEGGKLYGHQWRNFGNSTDQMSNLVESIITNPSGRRHLVMAWDASVVENNEAALPPCHIGFEVVIYKGKLNLKAWIRSNDLFLGAPCNIASYALLTHLLAEWTGYQVGELILDITNPHIYTNHLKQVKEYIENTEHRLPTLSLPSKAEESLESCLELTALDFKDALINYNHEAAIKAPLSVGG